uniref:Uncharacterized protein n=1 Tax=Rhizophora mucronata TaxID=61149 RepID=A0A2P2MX25_RHIMU
MLEFFAFLSICLARCPSTDNHLMKNTCTLVQILCYLLSILRTLLQFPVPFGADQTLAVLSNLACLSNVWLNCPPNAAYN